MLVDMSVISMDLIMGWFPKSILLNLGLPMNCSMKL